MGNSSIIMYTTEDGLTKIETTFDEDAVWLSLEQMAELFQRDKSTISRHIKNIFEEGELQRNSVVANFATTASDGKTYQVDYTQSFRPEAVFALYLPALYFSCNASNSSKCACGISSTIAAATADFPIPKVPSIQMIFIFFSCKYRFVCNTISLDYFRVRLRISNPLPYTNQMPTHLKTNKDTSAFVQI